MAQYKEIEVPDIGDYQDVPVIEILVKEGERVEVETPLITLESDKAAMDVPSPFAGKVHNVLVAEGDSVSQGDPIVTLEIDAQEATDAGEMRDAGDGEMDEIAQELESTLKEISADDDAGDAPTPAAKPAPAKAESVAIKVPDIGDYKDVEIIEVHVGAGDQVQQEDPLITLESDKAAMEVPAPMSGEVVEMSVKTGDRVSEGDVIGHLRAAGQAVEPAPAAKPAAGPASEAAAAKPTPPAPPVAAAAPAPPPSLPDPVAESDRPLPHASPSVRRFARELGADLTKITGSGPKNRILKTDVKAWVKGELSAPRKSDKAAAPAAAGFSLPEMPKIDFSKFGDIESKPLSRIKKLTAANLHRSWLHVPHVTQHDEADITNLEAFRQDLKREQETHGGARITLLSFLMKACVVALKRFPQFNASLDNGKENLILKKYYHLGIAVETEDGLVVPVVRNVDSKSVSDLAEELGDISKRARGKKLSPKDLQGASFTISSLGGIGGTAFTPIINAPEVAILGVSRSSMKPVYIDKEFVPRLLIPLSLSYDHRVIDGAEAARFTTFLATVLGDVRRLLL